MQADLRPWFEGGRDALGHADPAERALLIANAVLPGQPPAAISAAADGLLEHIGAAGDPAVPLAGPGLRTRLGDVLARPDALDYAWSEYPQLRLPLLRWLVALPGSDPAIGEAVWEQVSGALGELVVRQGDTTFLDVVATAARTASHALVADLLGRTACDPGVGRAVRRRLRDWAGAPGVEPAVRRAVAGACARALGSRYPRAALRLLRRLATSPEEAVLARVTEAVVELAAEPSLRGAVLEELAGWRDGRDGPDARRRHAGSAAFLALAGAPGPCAEPLLLAGGTASREALVAGWFDVLGTPSDWSEEELDAAVAVWLAFAARPPPDEAALGILAAAARRDGTAQRTLLRAARRWATRRRHDDVRQTVAGRLNRLVTGGR